MEKKVAIIHTSFVSVDDLKGLFIEILPEVKLYNIVDDSLLAEVMEKGGLTKGVTKRICNYAVHAQEIGADLILNQCSSVGEAVDVARSIVDIPYLKIDEPMAEEAVRLGTRISVVATVPTTLGPSIRLIERTAERVGKKVEIQSCLVPGALEVLLKEKDKEKHNAMVLDKINSIVDSSDVIVLAQGSMICLLPYLKALKVPVLTSPRLGVERVKKLLSL
jgi:Asp/Glu/hydantoin racemase